MYCVAGLGTVALSPLVAVMDWFVTDQQVALAYVLGLGAVALSPLVGGIVAIGVGNAIGIIAVSGNHASGVIAISAGGRADGMLIGIGDEARGLVAVAYSGRTATAFGRWPAWPGGESSTD